MKFDLCHVRDKKSIEKFNTQYKEMTGTDFGSVQPKSTNTKVNDKWVDLAKDDTLLKYSIPPLKTMLFQVLKEKYLMDRKPILKILNQLPLDILAEFLQSCSQDQTPVGLEIIQLLWEKNEDFSIVSWESVLDATYKHDLFFRDSYIYGISQNMLYPMYNDQFAINVYQNYSLFKVRSVQPENWENLVMLPKERVHELPVFPGDHSIVDKETFLEAFHRETNGLFKSLKEWPEGMVIHGGLITKCLLGATENIKGFESSDVDISFIDTCKTGILQGKVDMNFFYQLFGDSKTIQEKYSIVFDKSGYILTQHYPHKHYQFNFNVYLSIEEILLGCDIDSSMFLFNGTDVFTLKRGLMSMNSRLNFATAQNSWIRNTNVYVKRLLKYAKRGFNIYINNDEYKRYMDNHTIEKVLLSDNLEGLSYLYSCVRLISTNPALSETLMNTKSLVPYGEDWTKSKFDAYVGKNYQENYDGYNNGDWPAIVEIDHLGFSYFDRDTSEQAIAKSKINQWFDE
ncbi:hypothetical protein DLAC_02805 [Tieghemostelium lacteum]|uniref:Uncharacterized protein n=1 Tax=Tieghemostelium lacteum TaxID=361077 RepID=A0A152A3C0_TIELA|nr:hypothetical protein DLAC_02805 [Tieghemostelium lacteum]|eukprot:KYR00762.1 hypothetical protein DLAC_02805 [Tieghemostelium lacteum]